jgi:hypothetical protein
MAIFIELTTDPFEDIRNQQMDRQRGSQFSNSSRRQVRRPTRGLEIKEERPAIMKVIQANGDELPLIDAGGPSGSGLNQNYANFILQNVTEARMEKHQIVETFGESYIFFFGEAPRFIDVQLVLINSLDFNWEAEWWENYENNLRGTKLVERGAKLYLFYDDNIVDGYMLSSQAAKVSDQPLMVQLNFRMFVTGYRNISFVGNPDYPIRASAVIPEGIDLRDPNDTSRLFSNLSGLASGDARAQSVDDMIAVINSKEEKSKSSQKFFNDRSKLTNFLRSAPRSIGFPLDIVKRMEALGKNVAEEIRDSDKPLRTTISANEDEYLGGGDQTIVSPRFESGTLGLPAAETATIRTKHEVEDLWRATIEAMQCYGANLNSPKSLLNIGLMPKFGKGSKGKATFRPLPGVPFGIGLTDPKATNDQLTKLKKDPLGAIFGSSDSGLKDRRTTQGTGDKVYGFNTSYGSGPGFGKPGYGDYGGNGHGSGQGTAGDPGFKDPSEFSFVGVAGAEAAFNKLNKPKVTSTVFTSTEPGAAKRVGLGASNSGLSGSGSTRIDGKPSAFAIVSVTGVLKAAASASISASASLSIGGLGSTGCPPTTPDPNTIFERHFEESLF